MQNLEEVLSHYDINGSFQGIDTGPLVYRARFLPQPGTKLKNIVNSLDDIARELGVSSLRVETVDNSKELGFEYPKNTFDTIDFQTILSSSEFTNIKGELPVCLGVDIAGKPQFADLAKMPHLLVAGTTGSGKSVGLNTFVLSLIAKKTPEELKLVMIDPKRIEFAVYNNQKFMLYPVITETKDADFVLESLVAEMEYRYNLFAENLVKNIKEYNNTTSEKMPYIVCIIDEFADLISTNKNISSYVQRLAQKARAAGIHLIMATQRPSVDVVTGVLKANFPTRLSYKVASGADSRTILDAAGAENLIGRGDALFLASDGTLKRIHGAYVTDKQINDILLPYQTKTKPLNIPQQETDASKEEIKQNCIIEFWCSLKSGERKTIISWFLSMIKMFIKYFLSNKRR